MFHKTSKVKWKDIGLCNMFLEMTIVHLCREIKSTFTPLIQTLLLLRCKLIIFLAVEYFVTAILIPFRHRSVFAPFSQVIKSLEGTCGTIFHRPASHSSLWVTMDLANQTLDDSRFSLQLAWSRSRSFPSLPRITSPLLWMASLALFSLPDAELLDKTRLSQKRLGL